MAKPKKESTAIATTEDAESQLMERTGGFGESSHPGYARAEVLSVDKFNVQRSAVGSVFRGIYLYTKDGAQFHDKDTGEVKQLTFHFFQYLAGDGVGRWRCTSDEGLRQALVDGDVQDGDAIEFVKLGKVKLDGKRTMNTYKMFRLEPTADKE